MLKKIDFKSIYLSSAYFRTPALIDLNTHPIFTIFAAFESWESQLSNAAKIIKIWFILEKLERFQVGPINFKEINLKSNKSIYFTPSCGCVGGGGPAQIVTQITFQFMKHPHSNVVPAVLQCHYTGPKINSPPLQ